MTGRDTVHLLHNCTVLSFCPQTQEPLSVVRDQWLPQLSSDTGTAFRQHPARPCPRKGMDQPLHLPFPSHLLMTELLLLQDGGKLAPVWSSLINIHVCNTPDTDLIYTIVFLFSQSCGKGSCVNEEMVY